MGNLVADGVHKSYKSNINTTSSHHITILARLRRQWELATGSLQAKLSCYHPRYIHQLHYTEERVIWEIATYRMMWLTDRQHQLLQQLMNQHKLCQAALIGRMWWTRNRGFTFKFHLLNPSWGFEVLSFHHRSQVCHCILCRETIHKNRQKRAKTQTISATTAPFGSWKCQNSLTHHRPLGKHRQMAKFFHAAVHHL